MFTVLVDGVTLFGIYPVYAVILACAIPINYKCIGVCNGIRPLGWFVASKI